MEKKERTAVFILSVVMMVSMIASVYICIRIINKISADNAVGNCMTVASVVEDKISNTFLRPITVTEMMAQDYNLRKLLKQIKTSSAEHVEEEIASYLNSIQEGFDYQMVYVVDDTTKAYFTSGGICKYVDVEHDRTDIWYKEFVDADKEYVLKVDTDEVNQWSLSVFVNREILDEEGNFLGVCGVGIAMSDLLKELQLYEAQYGIKINMIDEAGLIQIDVDYQKILTEYMEHEHLQEVRDDKFLYEKMEDYSRNTIFIKDMGWYLVIKNNNPSRIDEVRIVMPSIVIFVLGIFFMGWTFFLQDRQSVQRGRQSGVKSLADIYISMYLLNIRTREVTKIKSNDYIDKLVGDDYNDLEQLFSRIIHASCNPKYLHTMLQFTDMKTLKQRMSGKKTIFCDYIGNEYGWCRARFIESGDEDDEPIYIFAVEVINEEKRKENLLEKEVQSIKMKRDAKEQFLVNMSCELKNSIKAILGMSTILLKESVAEQTKETAFQIQKEGNATLKLIENIIDFSRIEASDMEIEHEDYSLAGLLRSVLTKVEKNAHKKNLQVIFDIDENLPSELAGDENRIKQVLANIMDNAITHTEKGKVTLSVNGEIICERAMLHFSITDTREKMQREEISRYTAGFDIEEEQRTIKGRELSMGIARYLLILMGSELNLNLGYTKGTEYQFDLMQEIRNIEPIGALKM